MKTATPTGQNHFLETVEAYVDAVVQQSADRDNDRVRTIEEFLKVRRDASGCYPSFAVIELDMDLPDDVWRHSSLERLRVMADDMICHGNVSLRVHSISTLLIYAFH